MAGIGGGGHGAGGILDQEETIFSLDGKWLGIEQEGFVSAGDCAIPAVSFVEKLRRVVE